MIVTNEIAQLAQTLLKDSSFTLTESNWQSLTPLNLTPGQMVQGEVMANLPNNRYLIRLANQLLNMELPVNLQPGQTVELTYVSEEPQLIFAFSQEANSGVPVQISDTGRWLNLLATADGPTATTVSSLPRPSLVSPTPPNDPQVLAAGLRNVLSKSGIFYESHLAQWLQGNFPLAELLSEPQGALSRLADYLRTRGNKSAADAPVADGQIRPATENVPQTTATRAPGTTSPEQPTATTTGETPTRGNGTLSGARPGTGPDSAAPPATDAGSTTTPASVAGRPIPAGAQTGTVTGPSPAFSASGADEPNGTVATSPGSAMAAQDGPAGQPSRPTTTGAATPPASPPLENSQPEITRLAGLPERLTTGEPATTTDSAGARQAPNTVVLHGEPSAAPPQPHPESHRPPVGAPAGPPPAAGTPEPAATAIKTGDVPMLDKSSPYHAALPESLQGGIDPQTIPLIKEQLAVLNTGQFSWFGQVWPDQFMEWKVDERQGGGHQHGERSWETEVRLVLPRLGAVSAAIRLAGGEVAVNVAADEEQTSVSLAATKGNLEERMEAAGLRLSGLIVRHAEK